MALRVRPAFARYGNGAVPPDRPARRRGIRDDRHGSGRRLARCGGHLLNGSEHRFMFDYDDAARRATRDVVSRGIYAEMRKSNITPNGGVYISMAHLGPENVREEIQGHGQALRRLRV